jgi:hypothetical protein
VRDVLSFQKNWNNEIIAQFYATLYVEERGDTRKFHWMTEGRRYEITFEQFARLFGFGRNDANRINIHFASRLDGSRMRFMYPGSKRGNTGTTSDLLPFYAYLNHLFRRTMTPREGDSSNIPSYNRNLLVAMAPRPHDGSDLRAPMEEMRAAAPRSSPPRTARGRGQPRDKPLSPI